MFEPWVEEVSAGACGEFLTENDFDFFDIYVKYAGLSLGRGNGRCSGYIIFVIFAPQTKMLGYFLLLKKCVNRNKKDFASNQRKHCKFVTCSKVVTNNLVNKFHVKNVRKKYDDSPS